MAEPVFVSLSGERYEKELRQQYGVPYGDGQIKVGPAAFNALFEMEMRTALAPSDDDAAGMGEFLKPMMAAPGVIQQIQARYDVANVFAAYLEKRGMAMEDFEIKVVPDEQAMTQQDAGNIVPINQPSPVPAAPFGQY
jgi:hypothetical protein